MIATFLLLKSEETPKSGRNCPANPQFGIQSVEAVNDNEFGRKWRLALPNWQAVHKAKDADQLTRHAMRIVMSNMLS